jgi:hypothetical protein
MWLLNSTIQKMLIQYNTNIFPEQIVQDIFDDHCGIQAGFDPQILDNAA